MFDKSSPVFFPGGGAARPAKPGAPTTPAPLGLCLGTTDVAGPLPAQGVDVEDLGSTAKVLAMLLATELTEGPASVTV